MDNAVHFDMTQVNRELEKLGGRARNNRAVNAQAAEILRLMVDDKFEDEGPGWRELSEETLRRRRGGGAGARILQDTGVLVNSISTDSSAVHAEVFTNVPYSVFHITGTRHMDKRNFFDINEQVALRRIADLITESIAR